MLSLTPRGLSLMCALLSPIGFWFWSALWFCFTLKYPLCFRGRERRERRKGSEGRDRDRDLLIERDFHNVFMTASTEGKEAVIKRWMDRKKCGRLEAMRLAVEQWRWDNR